MRSARLPAALALLVIAFLTVFQASPANAQAGLAGTPLKVCIARVAAGDTPRAMLRAPRRFDCTTPQTRFGSGDYWAISHPLSETRAAGTADRVRMLSLWQSGVTLYAVYGDGRIVAMPTLSTTIGHNLQLGAIVEFAPPTRAAPLVRLLWRVDGAANARGIVDGARLSDAESSAFANVKIAAFYAAFVGIAFALIVYNLALWTTLRHRFQLFYCAMTALLIAYAFTSSAAMAWVWPDLDNNIRICLNYVLLGFAAMAAMLFARTFFERRVFDGWVGRSTTLAAAAFGSIGLLYVSLTFVSPALADRAASVTFLIGMLGTGPILWSAWRRGSRYLLLFTVTWAVPLIAGGLRILSGLRVIPTTFWIDNSTLLSLAIEALMSGVAIAWRVQRLSVERDEARARETAARLLADEDPLTGLWNRRALLERVVGREGVQTLHIIDIDHFKSINDTLGHDGGDEVLRVFSRALRDVAPPGAVVARMGGEEFAIVLPGDATGEPDTILSRLRQARMPFDVRVTASIGSCSGKLATEAQWRSLYRRADRALFDAKQAGRDRARHAGTLATAA
ncbi:GGDEF domain-containing protein [Sphingomonas sp. RS2018]